MFKIDSVVVYSSTVYSGVIEEVCITVLEQVSSLKLNRDFFAGYILERFDSADKACCITNIQKNTSALKPEGADFVDEVYNLIIKSAMDEAESFKVAEAAKAIESTQQSDVNITPIKKFVIIFNEKGIDTEALLKAVCNKWSFLPFWPDLVGSHAIYVEHNYLLHKEKFLDLHPEIILMARRLSDCIGEFKIMVKNCMQIFESTILVMALRFKENYIDICNIKIVDMIKALKDDAWIDIEEAKFNYGFNSISKYKNDLCDAVILAVAHNEFENISTQQLNFLSKRKICFLI